MSKVSVLIPAYNAEAYIAQAVDSALAQRQVEVEVIVIDDGSTDGTPRLLASYGDRIRVVRQKNAGHVKARNAGARIATGDWLAFLDADDEWLPDKLHKQLERTNNYIGLVYTERENFGDCSRITARQSDTQELLEGDLFQPLLLYGNFITVSSVLIRKAIFEQLGGFAEDLLVCEDWDMWLRYSAQYGGIGACWEPLTRYRWHAGAMTNNLERMLHGRLKVVNRALALPRGQKLPASVRRRAFANAWQTSAWYAAKQEPRRAFSWYTRSLQWWPWNATVYRSLVKCCFGMA